MVVANTNYAVVAVPIGVVEVAPHQAAMPVDMMMMPADVAVSTMIAVPEMMVVAPLRRGRRCAGGSFVGSIAASNAYARRSFCVPLPGGTIVFGSKGSSSSK